MMVKAILNQVDHLVYTSFDLALGIDEIEGKLGVKPVIGGRHPAWGTRNALLSLGEEIYLEVLAPDPEQSNFKRPRLFDVDKLKQSRLLTWVAKNRNLVELVEAGKQKNIDIGEIQNGSRSLPDGSMLSWKLTDPFKVDYEGLRPFFIDWARSPHPAKSAPAGCSLLDLSGQHPQAENVRDELKSLSIEMDVEKADEAALIAKIKCPKGMVELR